MNDRKADLCEPASNSLRDIVSPNAITDLIRKKKLDGPIKGAINRKNLEEWSIRHNLMHSLPDLLSESSTRKTAISTLEKWDRLIGSAVCGLFEFETVFHVYAEEILRVDHQTSYALFHETAHKLPGNFYRAVETEFSQCLVYRSRALKCAIAGEHAVAMTLLRSALESTLKGAYFLCFTSPKLVDSLDFRDGVNKVGLSKLAANPLDVDEKYLKSFRNMVDGFVKLGVFNGKMKQELMEEYSLMSSLSHSDPTFIMAVLSDDFRARIDSGEGESDDFSGFVENLNFANDMAAYSSISVLDLVLSRKTIGESLSVQEDSPPLSVLFYAGGLGRTVSKFESIKQKL